MASARAAAALIEETARGWKGLWPTAPDVPTHPVRAPRIAVMHTWQTTQTEGWIRVGFDEVGVPYDYISVHEVRDNPNLRDRYDVIVFGPSSGNALSVVNGLQGSRPVPWEKTDLTPADFKYELPEGAKQKDSLLGG